MLWEAVYIFELLFFLTPLWQLRKYIAPLLFLAVAASLVQQATQLTDIFLIFLAPIGLFRLINIARVIKNRMHTEYLRKVTTRTSLFLAAYSAVTLFVITFLLLQPAGRVWVILLSAQTVLCIGVLFIILKNIRSLTFKMPSTYLPDRDLPTVTVAIPARNETDDLERCLKSVLASDYPKLEVLVLDDCSQAKTADIIKSFAQGGVRFIKGVEPQKRWLAKNQAYQRLYKESSGELLLFCGVDVRLGPGAIRAMVNLMYARKKDMISVLPLRVAGKANTTIFQPMRYWWELAIPRRLFNKPAVLGTCWIISRRALKNLGGFGAVCHAIIPEAFFARELVKKDAYSFVRSSEELDVRTQKNLVNQRATTLRVRYPQLRRRMETLLGITLVQLIIFVAPLLTVVYMLATGTTTYILLPAGSLLAILIAHLAIIQVTNPGNVAISLITFPFAVITELAVGYVSMYTYEFGTVEWKDRNICVPVMHVYPRLPKA